MKQLLILFILSIIALPAFGQNWQRLPNPPVDLDTVISPWGEPRVPYFIDSTNGFVFDARETYWHSNLHRTSDGGLTWQPIPFFYDSALAITQMCFVSKTRGYVSTIAHDAGYPPFSYNGGIYETNDLGDHWQRISPQRQFWGVYATLNTVFALNDDSIDGSLGNILFSRDDGITWDSITQVDGTTITPGLNFQFVYGNKDSLVATVWFRNVGLANKYYSDYGNTNIYIDGAANALYDTYLVYSTDLGRSWKSSLMDSNYFWAGVALHILPHACNIIREYLDDRDILNDTYSFLEATEPYTNWDTLILHRETGAWIAGNSCVSYLSDACDGTNYAPLQDEDTTVMLFRSQDGGASWQTLKRQYGIAPVFEEIDDLDYQNMSVVGHGAVVYADSFGFTNDFGFPVVTSLWKSSDGGDGSLNASMLAPQFALGHSLFSSGTDTLTVHECSPSSIEVYNQNIGCSYGKFDSISIAGLLDSEYSVVSTHHCACQPMQDTSFITLQPTITGSRNITIHYHFTDDEFEKIDTSINITLILQSGSTGIPLSLSLNSTNITTQPGDTISIPVYLSGNATLGATSITLLFGIDTNMLQPIGFYPAISGITVGPITYSGGTGTVPLQSTGLTLNGETLIGTLRCIVYLADTLATSVTLSGATLTSANSPCVALSLITDSVNIEITGCGTKTLLQFMKTGQIPLGIQSITPNPAMNAVQINFINPLSSPISYEAIDALGATRLRGVTGEDALTLDVSWLAEGIYFFRAFTSGGVSVSREILVLR